MTDIEPRVPLEGLDPGSRDPGYWVRFQDRVMASVAGEIARRRKAAFTLDQVVLSWGRLVIPAAAAAAVAATFLVAGPSPSEAPGAPAGIEEVLALPRDGQEPLPAFFHSDDVVDRNAVLLAVEGL